MISIAGTWCEKRVGGKNDFDRRSFRWIARGKARILVGCPRGAWKVRAERCAKGLRAYAILTPASGRCPRGRRRIKKG